jgi:hypothetical protein
MELEQRHAISNALVCAAFRVRKQVLMGDINSVSLVRDGPFLHLPCIQSTASQSQCYNLKLLLSMRMQHKYVILLTEIPDAVISLPL